MYEPNNDNLNENGGAERPAESINESNDVNVSPAEPKADETSSQYRYVRPEQSREAYSEANYSPVNDAQNAVPRYYYTEKDSSKKQKPRKSGSGFGKFVAACLVCALIGGICGGAMGLRFGKNSSAAEPSVSSPAISSTPAAGDTDSKQNTGSTSTPLTTNTANGSVLSAEDIYAQACTQVVGITTEITYTNIFGSTSSGAVSGSGFVISADGYIMTNFHVIEKAVQGNYDITVMMNDGTSYVASVVGYEKDNDIAVLKIDATGLNPVSFADSSALKVGNTVYAVGNPLGELDYTMTSGMVSALDREITTTDSSTGTSNTINMFQIDAAVNSGNSGGPVYNAKGEVIGVVTAKYSDSGVEGLGFAIPANDAVYIANELITNGYVSGKAYFGITVITLSSSARQYWGIPDGAYIDAVDENSCAAVAGLQAGDTITQIDDTEIKSSADLVAAKKNYHAGDTATLTISRAGETLTVTITFDEEKAATVTQQSETQSGAQQGGTLPGFGGSGR